MSLISFKEASESLGFKYPMTIRDVVDTLGINPKPFPYNGNAKGLDSDDMRTLRRALGKPTRRKSAAAI